MYLMVEGVFFLKSIAGRRRNIEKTSIAFKKFRKNKKMLSIIHRN